MKLIDLKTIDYTEAWELQKTLFNTALEQKRHSKQTKNTLIFCQHPPVYTLGKSGNESNLLFSKKMLGAELIKIERGGDITFHGLEQLVGYPILDLDTLNIGIRDFVCKIEQVLINTISHYNIKAERDSKNAGVWIDVGTPKQRKIAALGFKISKKITMHGFALNVNTDLSWFQKIIPCGLVSLGVTSLEKELDSKQNFSAVQEALLKEFRKFFF